MSIQYAQFNSTTLPRREVRVVLRRPMAEAPRARPKAAKPRSVTPRSAMAAWMGFVMWSALFGAVAATGFVLLHAFGPAVLATVHTFLLSVGMSALLGGLGGAIWCASWCARDEETSPAQLSSAAQSSSGSSEQGEEVPLNPQWNFDEPLTGYGAVWTSPAKQLE